MGTGDSFSGLAKRYSAQTALVSQANHEQLPEAGGLVAIPVAYPGDRTVTRPAAKKTVAKRHTAAPAVASVKKPVAKAPAKAAQKSATKAPVHHTAALHTPNN